MLAKQPLKAGQTWRGCKMTMPAKQRVAKQCVAMAVRQCHPSMAPPVGPKMICEQTKHVKPTWLQCIVSLVSVPFTEWGEGFIIMIHEQHLKHVATPMPMPISIKQPSMIIYLTLAKFANSSARCSAHFFGQPQATGMLLQTRSPFILSPFIRSN